MARHRQFHRDVRSGAYDDEYDDYDLHSPSPGMAPMTPGSVAYVYNSNRNTVSDFFATMPDLDIGQPASNTNTNRTNGTQEGKSDSSSHRNGNNSNNNNDSANSSSSGTSTSTGGAWQNDQQKKDSIDVDPPRRVVRESTQESLAAMEALRRSKFGLPEPSSSSSPTATTSSSSSSSSSSLSVPSSSSSSSSSSTTNSASNSRASSRSSSPLPLPRTGGRRGGGGGGEGRKPASEAKSGALDRAFQHALSPAQQSKRQKQVEKLRAAEEKKNPKPRINLVVIGHVDAGKSTLMGHFLYLHGDVSDRTMHKYSKESKQMGKGSFQYAWVMDEHAEERSRGITVDVAVKQFETEAKRVTLLDAPGHRDFIPNMIAGATQADAAILVVPAANGEFESGFQDDGQTKEHAILAKALGVSQIILAINKLDTTGWSQERFDLIVNQVSKFLKKNKFKSSNIHPIPVSGLTGENLLERKEEALSSWYNGPTLSALIDQLDPPIRNVDKPLRMPISEIYKLPNSGERIAGKIETGSIIPKDKVLVMPLGEVVEIKSIDIQGDRVELGQAGDNVELCLKSISDPNLLGVGQILCSPSHPIPIVPRFKAQIITTNYRVPILEGDQMVLFTTTCEESCTITRLESLLSKKDGQVEKKRPRALPRNSSAIIEAVPSRSVCLELFKNYRELGRFSLRRDAETVAVGIITKLYHEAVRVPKKKKKNKKGRGINVP